MSWRPGMPGGYRVPNPVYSLLMILVGLAVAIAGLSTLGALIPGLGSVFQAIGSMGTWDDAALLLPGLAGRRLPRVAITLRAVLGFWRRGRRESALPAFDVQTDLELDSYSNVVTVKRRVERPRLLEPNVQYLVNDYGLTAVGQP